LILLESESLAIVSGQDTVLSETFVNTDDEVFVGGEPAGYLEFLTDGDGFRAVFWTTEAGTIMEVDTSTGEVMDSGLLPEERINTGCDACEFIDGTHPDCSDVTESAPDDGAVIAPAPGSALCGAGAPAALGFSMFAFSCLPRRRAA
jgi:hypothetical protein